MATTSGGPEKDVFYNSAIDVINGIPVSYVVYRTPRVLVWDDLSTPDFGLTSIVKYLASALEVDFSLPPEEYMGPGKANLQLPMIGRPIPPATFGLTQQSNRYKWGPWYNTTAFNGKAEVVFDDSLVPESFGSVASLNQAAIAKVVSGVARTTINESGYIELADFPNFGLVEQFLGNGPYITDMDIGVGADGVKTTYRFNTWTPAFGKFAKYNA